jgi:hypothetical protein
MPAAAQPETPSEPKRAKKPAPRPGAKRAPARPKAEGDKKPAARKADAEAPKTTVKRVRKIVKDTTEAAGAKGDGGEEAAPTDVIALLEEVQEDTDHLGTPVDLEVRVRARQLMLPLKRQAFKRAVTNPDSTSLQAAVADAAK